MDDINESDDLSVKYSRAFCMQICREYWKTVKEKSGVKWRFRSYNNSQPGSFNIDTDEVSDVSKQLAELDPEEAGYIISIHYQKLLPREYRAAKGIFYTPIHVVEKILSDAESAGVDFKNIKAIDPAAGGAAFLAPLCRRLIKEKRKNYESDQMLIDDVTSRLVGFELDPFAAWLSQFILDCSLALIAPNSKRPARVVHRIDALQVPESYFNQFDYVIGNPPYGKTTLASTVEDRYSDVVQGKPNLYQLFYKLAFLLVRETGFVHLITPTGFIGGSYFKKLRCWLESRSTAISFSFFEKRLGVFPGVQQELVISLFHSRPSNDRPEIYCLKGNVDISSEKLGVSPLFEDGVWILPQSKSGIEAGKLFLNSKSTLETHGYSVKTGHVVPFRSKEFLKCNREERAYPMFWAHDISKFPIIDRDFVGQRPVRWYKGKTEAGLNTCEAILIKRTSSKEQRRRIHTAIVDQSFVCKYGGYFAENHINVITKNEDAPVSLNTLNQLLSTRLFDELFRCSSGTVAVSASELRSRPLPSKKGLELFDNLLKEGSVDIESAARRAYGVDK